MTTIYDRDLDRNRANYEPLSPLSFLRRTAEVFPDHLAVIHGRLRYSYNELYERCRRLASALEKRGIKRGDTVAIMAPNTPAHLEAHFGIPATGAVINAINTRLDAAAIAFILEHGEAKILFTDREYSATVKAAVAQSRNKPVIIDIDDHLCSTGELFGEIEYEAFLQQGDPISCYFAEDADGQTGAGEWLAADDLFGQPHFASDSSHFVFEQFAERLDQPQVHLFRQAPDVVMRFDYRRGSFD